MLKAALLSGSLAAVLLGLSAAVLPAPGLAQAPAPQTTPLDLDDDQLDRFVSALQSVRGIEQATQAAIVAAVEAEGLTMDEFNRLVQTLQESNGAELPPPQVAPFRTAAEQVVAIQSAGYETMAAAIQAEDLTVEEFDQILYQAQRDPVLLEQINQRLAE
ncbi:DUF4168 domain-containing protein [Leptolyngbya sp. KIOST-1]|uniref:DUF4168 domain-containing protein n=1 Tax=Leptolyngbya sp. KIOST-1 TaxID=1229172 RepID=UPI00055EC9D0|nr:DUF4168 domain-containing protein [Leptolyngbya sp. KIOST-1]